MGKSWSSPFPPTDVMQTSSGSIRGIQYIQADGRAVNAYLGIPYAQPPVGELRFKVGEISVWNRIWGKIYTTRTVCNTLKLLFLAFILRRNIAFDILKVYSFFLQSYWLSKIIDFSWEKINFRKILNSWKKRRFLAEASLGGTMDRGEGVHQIRTASAARWRNHRHGNGKLWPALKRCEFCR